MLVELLVVLVCWLCGVGLVVGLVIGLVLLFLLVFWVVVFVVVVLVRVFGFGGVFGCCFFRCWC